MPATGWNVSDYTPLIIVGPARFTGRDDSTSQNLSADGVQGSYSVTIANAANFTPGTFVLLDERSGASWQPTLNKYACTAGVTPCPPFIWEGDRVSWQMHWPHVQWTDDSQNSDAAGPYDTRSGTLPASMGWFSRTDRPTNEIKEVASVSGNTVTFTSPLSIGYRVSHAAQLTRYTAHSGSGASGIQVTYAGVENMSLVGGTAGNLVFSSAAYSWAKGIEVTQFLNPGISIDNSFRVEVRDSWIHTASFAQPGGGSYLISVAHGSSELLIENNIIMDADKIMVFRQSGAGSVVAYNYTDDSWIDYNVGWVEVGLNASHMAGGHHVLFEGNYSHNFDSDDTHGNAIYMTVFRNWLSGQRRDFVGHDNGNVRTVGLGFGSWWHSFVGNVLGRRGQMTGWHYTDTAMSCDASGNNCAGNSSNWSDKDIWKLGYDQWTNYADPRVISTVIRDGNYDYLTNSQHWHNTPGGFSIPNSLYLASKPGFFGSYPWPWVDPMAGTTYTLPAKYCYDHGQMPTCLGSGGGTALRLFVAPHDKIRAQ